MSTNDLLRRKLEKLEPILGSQINSLLAAVHQSRDHSEHLRAQGLIEFLYQKHCTPDIAEPDIVLRPPRHRQDGEIILGDIRFKNQQVDQVSLRIKDLTRHVGIWGTTGSGKTNLAHVLIDQLSARQVPFTIFDWKQNFRSLAHAQNSNRTLYFTVGSKISPLFWNPLEPPPNTNWEDWLKLLIEAMKHSFFLGHGVERILQQVFFDLADRLGGNAPTFLQSLQHLESQKAYGREAMWIDSAKRALGALSFGGISRVFNTPLSTGPILDRPVAYGLETLTDSERTFFTEALCLWAYFARLNQREPRKRLEHVFIMEEAHNVLTRAKQSLEDRESLMDGILRQVRELGEGFVIIDQQPSSLTNSALANLNTHFVFNLHNTLDIRAISECIGLDPEDRDYLKLLKPGEAITKLNGVAKPFLVSVPESDRNGKRMSDEELRWRTIGDSVRSVAEVGIRTMTDAIRVVRQLAEGSQPQQQNLQNQSSADELSDAQGAFLDSVGKYVHLATVERYKLLGLTAYMGDKIKDQLVAAGYIEQADISTPQGRVALLKLTDAGRDAIGVAVTQQPLLGGPSHEYWKHRIAVGFRARGWNVEEEVRSGSGQHDLVVQKDGERRAIEVETGCGNVRRTIQKLQAADFQTSIIAPVNRIAEQGISELLAGLPLAGRSKIIVIPAHKLCA